MINPQHRVTIEYCVPCDYFDVTVRTAAEILERWAPILVGLELVTADKGKFRVTLDDRAVYDKAELKRLPEPGEVARLLGPDLGPALTWRKVRTEQA